jgi:hypothetical protein
MGVVLLVVVIAAGWAASYRSAATTRVSWQYKIIDDPTQHKWIADQFNAGVKTLNDLGWEGWELVGVSDEVQNSGYQSQTRLIFKRAQQ